MLTMVRVATARSRTGCGRRARRPRRGSTGCSAPAASSPRSGRGSTRAHEPPRRVGGATRVVLAAARDRRRDHPAVEVQRQQNSSRTGCTAGSSRMRRRFTCYAALSPESCDQLLERSADPTRSLTLDQTCRVGTGDDDEVVTVGQLVVELQKASLSARLTALRSTASPTSRLTEMPRRTRSVASASRERVEDEEPIRRVSARRGRRGRSRRCATGGRAFDAQPCH